jgi:tripartite ATP-independent transporter DctM subunit
VTYREEIGYRTALSEIPKPTSTFGHIEDVVAVAVLAVIVALPIVEFAAREFLGVSVRGAISAAQHLTLSITFIGAAIAARSDRLLALSTTKFLPEQWQLRVKLWTGFLAVGVGSTLAIASVQLVLVDMEYGDTFAWGIPVWAASTVMPIVFIIITFRLFIYASDDWHRRLVVACGIFVLPLIYLLSQLDPRFPLIPGILALIIGTAFGMPIMLGIGGAGALLFFVEGTPISAVPGEAYRMATSPMLPAIPLFTLAGYILASGGSSQRLLGFFSALVGRLPGGLAIVVTLLLAFFTPLTGASGITILAMGGLLLPMMIRAGYPESHSMGLVTVSGSIGIMLPPSLPVILYAYYAELELSRLFIGGFLPGVLLIVAVAGWGAWRGWRAGVTPTKSSWKELGISAWRAKWELLLPLVIVGGIFGGLSTLVEAAALTVLYALVLELVVFRELRLNEELLRIVVESATMVGGFMIILSVALGFTNYLIIEQIPMHALNWVKGIIESPVLILLALNVLLIIVGALMDIYSAIIIIVPLIAPMAAAYGIDPIHLGVVFLANMQLGYLMPPMGENLFLSAYRFGKSLPEVYQATIPYVVILAIVILLITFVPWITLAPLAMFE